MENKNNSFVVTVTPITDNLDSNTDKKLQAPEKKKFKNQEASIKVPNESKVELEALMKITKKNLLMK